VVGPGRYGREGTFRDRHEAGRLLGERLAELRSERPVVLALPRGGVPVAAEVARALDAPLDVIVVRKLGVPFQPEVGFGAIGEGGVRLFDADLIRRARITEREVAEVEARERAELERRVRLYRGDHPPLPVAGRTVVIVDDGLATGGSARAAVQVVRAQGASRIVLAVPVAPPETVRQLQDEADQVVSLLTPPRFVAVGLWYDDFEQTSDEEVAALLRDGDGLRSPDSAGRGTEREVVIRLDGAALQGHLDIPAGAEGIVLFAHGSGSSRHSPRNQAMAGAFHTAGLATLLFDLLTPEESDDRRNVFDIELLADRLLAATEWVRAQPDSTALARGYFGASTGGGAALWAAGTPGNDVRAVVSRGGRPDLAGPRLADVRCPTLLIVGGADREVLELNRSAASELRCPYRLAVVPGATHLFEEPGAMESVARLAIGWFGQHLAAEQPGAAPGDSRPGEG
jgi:putative phosphoribosyl transferase